LPLPSENAAMGIDPRRGPTVSWAFAGGRLVKRRQALSGWRL
jgi:hypothetical protein